MLIAIIQIQIIKYTLTFKILKIMANNCLVTKLKAVVNNPALRKQGEVELYTLAAETATSVTNCIELRHSAPIEIRVIEGDGYLVDSDLTSNPVKSKKINADVLTSSFIYFTNHTMTLGISDFKNVSGIAASTNPSHDDIIKNWLIDFDAFEKYTNHIDFLHARGVTVKGDVKNLKCLSGLYLTFPSPTQNLNNNTNQMGGNINGLDGVYDANGINSLYIIYPTNEITGDLVQLINSNPNNLRNGEMFKGANYKLTGDLSLISPTAAIVFITGSPNNTFTYSRSRNGNMIFLEEVNLGNGLEQYLIDQAAAENRESPNRTITVYGTIDTTKPAVQNAINVLKTRNLSQFKINGVNYNN